MAVSLHLASSFHAAWESVILPWFERVAASAHEQTAPVSVVTPFRSHAQSFKSKLLTHGISLLGIRFLVPAELREFLLHDTALKLPLREHLRLLLSIAADESRANIDSEQADFLIARAVARDPDYFLRLFDELSSAGWQVAELAHPALAGIAGRVKKMVRDCGFAFVYEADRRAVEDAPKLPPRLSRLLVTGFDSTHWSVG